MNDERINQIISLMDSMLDDGTIPKNVKRAISDAKAKLREGGEPTVQAGSAIYLLEEMSEDINLPPHARTQIWNLLNALERIKEKQ